MTDIELNALTSPDPQLLDGQTVYKITDMVEKLCREGKSNIDTELWETIDIDPRYMDIALNSAINFAKNPENKHSLFALNFILQQAEERVYGNPQQLKEAKALRDSLKLQDQSGQQGSRIGRPSAALVSAGNWIAKVVARVSGGSFLLGSQSPKFKIISCYIQKAGSSVKDPLTVEMLKDLSSAEKMRAARLAYEHCDLQKAGTHEKRVLFRANLEATFLALSEGERDSVFSKAEQEYIRKLGIQVVSAEQTKVQSLLGRVFQNISQRLVEKISLLPGSIFFNKDLNTHESGVQMEEIVASNKAQVTQAHNKQSPVLAGPRSFDESKKKMGHVGLDATLVIGLMQDEDFMDVLKIDEKLRREYVTKLISLAEKDPFAVVQGTKNEAFNAALNMDPLSQDVFVRWFIRSGKIDSNTAAALMQNKWFVSYLKEDVQLQRNFLQIIGDLAKNDPDAFLQTVKLLKEEIKENPNDAIKVFALFNLTGVGYLVAKESSELMKKLGASLSAAFFEVATGAGVAHIGENGEILTLSTFNRKIMELK